MTKLPVPASDRALMRAEPPSPPALPPSRGLRALGWVLMTMSVGLVSCQSLFWL